MSNILLNRIRITKNVVDLRVCRGDRCLGIVTRRRLCKDKPYSAIDCANAEQWDFEELGSFAKLQDAVQAVVDSAAAGESWYERRATEGVERQIAAELELAA